MKGRAVEGLEQVPVGRKQLFLNKRNILIIVMSCLV